MKIRIKLEPWQIRLLTNWLNHLVSEWPHEQLADRDVMRAVLAEFLIKLLPLNFNSLKTRNLQLPRSVAISLWTVLALDNDFMRRAGFNQLIDQLTQFVME